ncbi:MAG: Mov34/MPN/PAD-1 family protein [Bacteroidia bacterium]|nr:Mov34/MPN/PAD-1 family protein [Bacteroidia bacterium]
MKLECVDIGLKIQVEKSLLDRMYSIGMEHYPAEFGGLLIGKYAPDLKTCIISEILLPIKYVSSRYYFDRGIEGLTEKLEELYNKEEKLIYVGEWHTHPDMPAEPSGTDRKAMKEIAEHNDVNISNPILLIVSNSKKEYDFNFYLQYKGSIHKYITL